MPDPGQRAAMHHDPSMAGPIGQAIEMDERHGSPPAAQDQGNYTPALDSVGTDYGLRNSDADVMGMVGMQHGQSGQPSRKESERSASNYSGDR